MWKSLNLYHQNGTIKGGGKGEEGKGGAVMDVVPQLPSFSLYLSFL